MKPEFVVSPTPRHFDAHRHRVPPIEDRLCRKATTAAVEEEILHGRTLPPRSLEAGVRRLGNLALMTGLVVTASGLLEQLVFVPASSRSDAVRFLGIAGAALASFWVFAWSRRRAVEPARFLDAGLLYEVVVALLLGVAYHAVPSPGNLGYHGWSPIAVWVAVFPLIVPSARGKTLLASTVAGLMDPLGVALNALRGHPVPGLLALAQMLLPTAAAVVAGVVGARIVYRLSASAGLAREMGSYRLVAPLGHGGMGEVWRAEHRMFARAAAIKLIRAVDGGTVSRPTLLRFQREALATASLRSQHTIQVYDYGVTEDGTFYYVMELLDGFDLDDLVRRFGPLPDERVVHLLIQVCDSLEEAHRAGLVHRDVKPGNIFACRYGLAVDFVKVLDFGLVKPVTEDDAPELTADGHVHGTPSYMAPEVTLGRDVDGRADLYGLGCVGYYLLTGYPPFPERGRKPVEVMFDHAYTPPQRPSDRAGVAIHGGLEALLMSCLAKSPDRRPGSALELGTKLAALRLEERWTPERARLWWDGIGSHDVSSAPTRALSAGAETAG